MKTIYFKAWQSNIASKDKIRKWFPRFVKKKKAVTTVQVARKTSEKCTLTVGDVFLFSSLGHPK